MKTYVFLAIAIIAEVIGTTLMKSSEGFTKLWPSLATAFFYCAAFYSLSQTLESIPTGIAYAIWSGVGIVLISIIAWIVNGQRLDFASIIGMCMICLGVVVINVFSKTAVH
ncbi:EmrE family multidrug efflux SMR transporter [Enterobacter huaxiensis]|uniref:EmrE family multidrug efflux SMR transporter n=1 Tax=Enterobacter huaxiensis TaxID=2494702 RepID=UPI000E755B33|nr:EmrE family multidrug efflux SMR transporter [Enterobacter huaxiensis]UNC52644.1 EmrE family multidrug efflux SMR transporter [Enterobacter huaxiensis]